MHIDYNAGHEKSTDWSCRSVNFGIVGMWGKIRLGATGRVVPARLSSLLNKCGYGDYEMPPCPRFCGYGEIGRRA